MYSVWLIPRNADTEYLGHLIRNLSQKYNAPEFIPHITIYGDVNAGQEIVDEAVKHSIKGLKKFTIKTSNLAYEDYIWKTLFINIEQNLKLLQINEKLSEKLGEYIDYQFKPHISLIYKKMAELEKQKIIHDISIKNEFVIDKAAIIKSSENVDEWEMVSQYIF